MRTPDTLCAAFQGGRCLAKGPLAEVALAAKAALDASAHDPSALSVLVFDHATAEVIELDWRGTPEEVLARLQAQAQGTPTANPDLAVHDDRSEADTLALPEPARGPGRPKLGVVAREVTLLPRHWEWLASQPGGASVALRKLVEVARRSSEVKDRVRQASAVAYRFMSTIAGHEAGFEEASRALFAGDQAGFEALIAAWPADVQNHLKALATDAFWA
jgi:hypothetical protein